jgi:hypothetical protein
MATYRIEWHNLHGTGNQRHEVYDLPPVVGNYWAAVTDVPCPVEGCQQTVVWYEAGYVPGYRVCMAPGEPGSYDHETLRHRFLARGTAEAPTLIRDV